MMSLHGRPGESAGLFRSRHLCIRRRRRVDEGWVNIRQPPAAPASRGVLGSMYCCVVVIRLTKRIFRMARKSNPPLPPPPSTLGASVDLAIMRHAAHLADEGNNNNNATFPDSEGDEFRPRHLREAHLINLPIGGGREQTDEHAYHQLDKGLPCPEITAMHLCAPPCNRLLVVMEHSVLRTWYFI